MNTWWLVLAMAVVAQFVGWLWQKRTGNATIVDAIWAFGVAIGAAILAITATGAVPARVLLVLFASVWGLRLGWHLFRRAATEKEDGRYAHLRTHWRDSQIKWFGFFMAQAVLIALFCLPFVPVALQPADGLTWFYIAGFLVWAAAITGESIADRQLQRFRSQPSNAGKVCQVGLWRYSRHPNYFFEWLHWFAYPLLAWGAPHAWLSWLGPIVMYIFLRWLSGIPWTEAQALRKRGDLYREYQRTTPMLFPWFPRQSR